MKIATLVLILRDSMVLLGEKKTGEIGKGTLNAPGGKQKPDESIADCMVREIQEEVGITLDPEHAELVAIVTFFADNIPDFEVHVFRTETFSGEPHETAEMIPEWFPVSVLPFERMLESDFAWFTRAIEGEPFRANVHYRGRAIGYQDIEFLPLQPT